MLLPKLLVPLRLFDHRTRKRILLDHRTGEQSYNAHRSRRHENDVKGGTVRLDGCFPTGRIEVANDRRRVSDPWEKKHNTEPSGHDAACRGQFGGRK